MRIVIGEDAALMSEALSRLLSDFGHSIVATASDGPDLVAAVDRHRPDLVIADIRMPPNYLDDGIIAAHQIRAAHPSMPVLVLSNHLELRYAAQLLGDLPSGLGYLLKERIATLGALEDAIERLRRGECVIDPSIVSRVLKSRQGTGRLAGLSEREYQVLQLMAEGASNRGIAHELAITERTVEGHVASIFSKLGIYDDVNEHRRIVAVLRYLRER